LTGGLPDLRLRLRYAPMGQERQMCASKQVRYILAPDSYPEGTRRTENI
jgi:hypothetical protein